MLQSLLSNGHSHRGEKLKCFMQPMAVGLLLASAIWLFVSRLGQSSWRYMFLVGVLPALLLLCTFCRWVDVNLRCGRKPAGIGERAQQRVQMGKGSSHDKQLVAFYGFSDFVRRRTTPPRRDFAVDVGHYGRGLVVGIHLDSRIRSPAKCPFTKPNATVVFNDWSDVQFGVGRWLPLVGILRRYSRA